MIDYKNSKIAEESPTILKFIFLTILGAAFSYIALISILSL